MEAFEERHFENDLWFGQSKCLVLNEVTDLEEVMHSGGASDAGKVIISLGSEEVQG